MEDSAFCHGRACDRPTSWLDLGPEPMACAGVLALESQSPKAGRGTRRELIYSPAPEQMAACSLLWRWLGPALCGRACCVASRV